MANGKLTLRDTSPDMIIPKHVAKFAGLVIYRTGKPCKRGHKDYRYISCDTCLKCREEGKVINDPDYIKQRLEQDYTLTNRGTGWYLAEPYVPYTRRISRQVSEQVVEQMEKDGIIKIDMPYISSIARLK